MQVQPTGIYAWPLVFPIERLNRALQALQLRLKNQIEIVTDNAARDPDEQKVHEWMQLREYLMSDQQIISVYQQMVGIALKPSKLSEKIAVKARTQEFLLKFKEKKIWEYWPAAKEVLLKQLNQDTPLLRSVREQENERCFQWFLDVSVKISY